MKDKPQMIKTMIDNKFLSQYTEMLIPAISRKFGVKPGIEGSLFSDTNSVDDMFILFLSTDEVASDVLEFVDSKWEFIGVPELIN